MRKLVLSSLLAVLLLSGCGNKVEDSVAQMYIDKAEEVVQYINNNDYEKVTEQFDEIMSANLTVESMSSITPVITASGEFEKISKKSVEEKDGTKIVVLVAKYSNENRVFTISYNDKDEIVGLFIQ